MTARTRIRHKPRRLKIGYHYYDRRRDGHCGGSRTVPFLRLSGDWLEHAGFTVGQHVRVQITNRRIVLVPES